MFTDRIDAGQRLAKTVRRFEAAHPLVLALPRGGVVVGAALAQALQCDFDVLLVKKLRAPGNPELALGAICEAGHCYVNPQVQYITGANQAYLDHEIAERQAEIAAQQKLYRAVKPKIPTAGRVVLLVDDGLATGATMITAIQVVALTQPQKLVVAVPVSPPDTLEKLAKMKGVDEVVCLETPDWFTGVGQFYENFTQVDDDEVAKLLRQFV